MPPVATLPEAPPKQQLFSPPPPAPAAPQTASQWPSSSGQAGGVLAETQPPQALPPSATRNLLVILHGKRVDDELLRNALQEVKQQGHQVSVRVTFGGDGDVEQFVGEAVRLNASGTTSYQTVVAGGGDGTLNEVVTALMQHREAVVSQGLSVALIPLGTANDFAATSGISVDPREALRVALDPSTIRPIDVATVNGRPFLNVAVAGGLAEVPPDELSSKWKRLLGPVAIAWHVLKRLSSKRLLQPHACTSISFTPQPAASVNKQQQQQQQQEGSKQVVGQQLDSSSDIQQQQCSYEFQTDLLMLVAGNSRQMGGTVAVCPDATLDDGLLDFTLLTGSSLAGQAATLVSALASRDDEDSALNSGIAQLRASRLVVCAQQGGGRSSTNSNSSSNSNAGGGGGGSDTSIPVNRDGEPEEASHRLVFEVLHRVLPMHLPDDRLLVTGQTPKQQQQLRQHIIKGSIKQPGRELFVPASSVLPPLVPTADNEGSSSSKNSGRSRGRGRWSRHRHRGLTVKALRRMLVLATPEGLGVRRRAHLMAVGRKLCVSLGVVLLGGVLGWVVGSRAAKADQQQQQQQQQQDLQKEQQRSVAAAKQSEQVVSKQQRREQRRQEAARVAAAAVV